jgi:hypothetical protein
MSVERSWIEGNQQGLLARLARLRARLTNGKVPETADTVPAPALDVVASAFSLSPFEQEVLLLAAAVELDASFAAACAEALGDPRLTAPTFSLALARLSDPHWSAITPAAPLRYWHLVELGPGETVTQSPIRLDERVLHFLTGISYIDPRLQPYVRAVAAPSDAAPSHRELAARIARSWAPQQHSTRRVAVQLAGADVEDAIAVAALACEAAGIRLHRVHGSELPPLSDRELFARLWDRDAVLERSAILVECADADARRAAAQFVDSAAGLAFLVSREPVALRTRDVLRFDVGFPLASEQRSLWHEALGEEAASLNGAVDEVVAHFRLGAAAIRASSVQARAGGGVDRRALWHACRIHARTRLDGLAERIEPTATWSDLVLPEPQMRSLREIASQVRHRATVYDTWGFAGCGARGLGISALFAGSSGTGKTLAAEVLACDLALDLYRIDLSQVVSKYIGETEKNLQRVFDAAEEGGAVLLFDEADALFGERSDVRDSHDRYANIEVSYLLQRMEAYRGLAILTTNMKTLLDTAFLRRIRFVVQFPFPDPWQRAEIWRRMFPAATPTDGLELHKLSLLSVAGGNIRNIALGAAFLAAEAGEPVRMAHVLRAARTEYSKLEKPLTDSEIRGWV